MPRLCPRHGARQGRAPGAMVALPRPIARALPVRRDGDIAPYRHYAPSPRSVVGAASPVATLPARAAAPHRPWRLATAVRGLASRALPPRPAPPRPHCPWGRAAYLPELEYVLKPMRMSRTGLTSITPSRSVSNP